MTIKEVSEKYQITQDTLRYYERIGMIRRFLERPVVFVITEKRIWAGLNSPCV